MSNYTPLHLHTMLSNAFTVLDSVTSYKQYIDQAVEYGMKAIAFTEHGSVLEWKHKLDYAKSKGIKYIHGTEAYITESLDEKVYDNYHVVLLAKNTDGFKELNKLISQASIREDRYVYDTLENKTHYHYQPRMTYEMLKNTSDNIIIMTACLGSILNNAPDNMKIDFLEFMSKNSHRCFLEIAHHNVEDQRKYNMMLLALSKKYNIKLVFAADTHSLNASHEKGRSVLQRSKNIHFENEDGWDLSFKSYKEIVQMFKKQYNESFPYLEAIEQTNVIADMIDEYQFDTEFKYPKLWYNPEKFIVQRIKEGVKWRGVKVTQQIKDRIVYELNVFKKNKAIDFILLDDDVKKWCRDNGIEYGESRGSISGSYVAYLLGITHIDSIKYDLVFERFMSGDRLGGLADIDSDYDSNDIPKIKEYLYNKHGLVCSDIVTFNTIQLKGAIKDVCRGLGIDLSISNYISENVESQEQILRKQYPQVFEYVDLLTGVITSVGSHPAGVIISDRNLAEEYGIFYSKDSYFPISQINMKEVESLSYLKLDLLKLDTVGIINETCKFANIERVRPYNINLEDEKVWMDMLYSGTAGIFQWNKSSGAEYYKKLFRPETTNKIKELIGEVNYLDLFSIGNAAIRPSGDSYREALANAEILDYGHEALNEFLKDTFSRLVYQEQIIKFLNRFCGFSMGRADIARRAIAKKYGTESLLPEIKSGFIKTMKDKYNTSQEESEQLIVSFLKVIEDASNYGFSINHSLAYSIIGYETAWLRYYYPIEFLTASLNYAIGSEEKASELLSFAKQKGIEIKQVKFRYSKDMYIPNKETNSIYKGIYAIKGMNKEVSNQLYELRNNKYNNFLELLIDIKEKTSCSSSQLDMLIKLDFFSEFGKSAKLLKIVELSSYLDRKQINKKDIEDSPFHEDVIFKYCEKETEKMYRGVDFAKVINEYIPYIDNENISFINRLKAQRDGFGYFDKDLFDKSEIDGNYCIIKNINKKYTPRLTLQSLSGLNFTAKIKKAEFNFNLKENDIIYIQHMVRKSAAVQTGVDDEGRPKWEKDESRKDNWIEKYKIISCSALDK